MLYEQQMQDKQQVHSPSKQRHTSHTQQPLTSGAELALGRDAQQPTHCAPSRTRRNPNACAQDMWHTHTFGIDAARERLPVALRAGATVAAAAAAADEAAYILLHAHAHAASCAQSHASSCWDSSLDSSFKLARRHPPALAKRR